MERSYLEKIEVSGDLNEIALSPDLVRLTRTIVGESSQYDRHEQGGFFGGVVRNGLFLLWDNRQTASGEDGKCVLYDRSTGVQNLDLDFHTRREKAIPDFRTVRYHSHPRVSRKTLVDELGSEAERIIQFVQREYDLGVYSFLGIDNLDDALNEALSRHLSSSDLAQNKGRYHLLISPTIYLGRELSHINFYDLERNRVLPVRVASETELRPFKKIENKVLKEWKIANFGTHDFSLLTPREREKIYMKIHHPNVDIS